MTAVQWDYTELASTYSSRPPYAPRAVDRIVGACGREHPRVADVGAGTGHLTLDLLARGCSVDAVEPNEAMRTIGVERTAEQPDVRWVVGTGEDTGLPKGSYDLVTFGSSFSTVDPPLALRETARILHDDGWFACIWNHRQLDDPLQAEIEAAIHDAIPDYSYGSRREDQAPVIAASGLFEEPTKLEEPIHHRVDIDVWLSAWRSHATLQRQAGPRFEELVDTIEGIARARAADEVEIPYTTVGWLTRRRRERS